MSESDVETITPTLIGPELYSSLLSETTKLKPAQIKSLIDIVSSYDEAQDLIYEIIGLANNNVKYESIKDDLINECFNWEGSFYNKHRQERDFQDSILEKPPEIREGENECPKCHQKKTLVVEMQTRSADEGYTYYIHCFNPKCRAVTR